MKLFYRILSMAVFVGFVSSSPNAQGQGRNSTWYFGNQAGIVFSGSGPVAVANGALNSYEACSSIATPDGGLALYTDGEKAWDASHQIMPNGFGLGGHTSGTQSALILPNPGNAAQYIIFTVDAIDNNLVGGLRYSLVDMSLRGGLGDVLPTAKAIRLPTPIMTGKVTEKLTAALHANGRDYWVVVHGWQNNEFYSFLVSTTGVSTTPVISPIGPIHSGGGSFFGAANAVGYMKISPLGTHLALAKRDSDFELYNFNNSSGIVSNPLSLRGTNLYHYGIEFSSDNTKLYTSMYSDGGVDSQIYQFNLVAGSPASISNSRQTIASVLGLSAPLQLGPDGKIYISALNRQYLHVINQPNALGNACAFQQNAVFLGSKVGQLGLPNFPNAFARQITATTNAELAAQVTLAPNPARKIIQLTVPSYLLSNGAQISFINSLGQVVKQMSIFSKNQVLSTDNLASGLYTIRIHGYKGSLVVKKLQVE